VDKPVDEVDNFLQKVAFFAKLHKFMSTNIPSPKGQASARLSYLLPREG
jgi:hypothetical protein